MRKCVNGVTIKYCERCLQQGKLTEISRYPGDSWNRWARIQYCPDCAAQSHRETKRRVERERREARRKAHQERKTQVKILEETTEILRENLRIAKRENVLLEQKIRELIHEPGG